MSTVLIFLKQGFLKKIGKNIKYMLQLQILKRGVYESTTFRTIDY